MNPHVGRRRAGRDKPNSGPPTFSPNGDAPYPAASQSDAGISFEPVKGLSQCYPVNFLQGEVEPPPPGAAPIEVALAAPRRPESSHVYGDDKFPN